MWPWQKKDPEEVYSGGTARAALDGALHGELIRATLLSLARDARGTRIGVWLEQDAAQTSEASAVEEFRGMVWESGDEHTPAEWQRLALESPLPRDLLISGKSVEQEFGAGPGGFMFGPLIGLHQAVWTPIQANGRLRGVLLTGSPNQQPSVSRERAESAAAELALALEFHEARRLARERQTDLRLHQQILTLLAGGASSDTILSQLAASCTEVSADGSGPGAAFAVIGQLPAPRGDAATPEMEFSWESGDPQWTQTVEREPLAAVWREALRVGHVVGGEPPASFAKSGIARFLAIPLASAEQQLGVFVAGVSLKSSSLQTLDRLELRAALAATALERRRLNTERVRRAARRQALLEGSPEATILVDARGAILNLNASAAKLLEEFRPERSREPAQGEAPPPSSGESVWYIGGRLAQLFCAREQPRIEEWIRHVLAPASVASTEAPTACEAELLNGIRVRLHAPVAAGDDLAAVVLDPAAVHEAAQLRSRTETELYNVLEWVEEGILLFGPNHAIRAMNTRFAQIAGLSPEEAAACTTLESLISQLAPRAAEPEFFAQRWRELARGSDGVREEVPLARPVPRVLERSVRPVLDSLGRRLGRIEIYRDLTAQRVFQAKLLQTEKLAALGQMITGVAHELSNPLTSILGYSQRLLVRNDLAGRTQEARQIFQEAERASAILRQLLLTARETQPERKRVSLNQVVQKAWELQRFDPSSEKVRLELDLDPALPFVLGDAGQLQQVIMNLIGNSRQALAQEGREGTIRLRTARSINGRVLLEASDDGPGIPQAILARIFDPFFTTKPAGVGTGLGLAVVLSVVREHGGQVHVTSPPGGGATFTVELPAATEASAESGGPRKTATPDRRLSAFPLVAGKKSRTNAPQSAVAHRDHRGTRVLVVEDEPTVARLIADVLEDDGMLVDVFFDSREALDRALRGPFDLIICDMKMPGIDGPHFFRALAETPSPLRDRFLFVTGDVLAPQTQEFLEHNRIPYVAKPFRVEELTERVYSLLDGERAGRAAAARKAQ